MWKGDQASYAAIHMWVRYHFGKPGHCENCGTTEKRMYHWANISREYKRERTDWLRLCVPCHKSHDIKALGGKIKARLKKLQPSKQCLECGAEFFKQPRFSKAQWESQALCGIKCRSIVSGRKRLGDKQSVETRVLKSQKLRERWVINERWREHMTTRMIGNRYAAKG